MDSNEHRNSIIFRMVRRPQGVKMIYGLTVTLIGVFVITMLIYTVI